MEIMSGVIRLASGRISLPSIKRATLSYINRKRAKSWRASPLQSVHKKDGRGGRRLEKGGGRVGDGGESGE